MTHNANTAGRADPGGSRILNEWNAQRQAQRVNAQGSVGPVPVSEITRGSEAYSWLTGVSGRGRPISERGAMSVATVYSCVSLIGGAIAATTIEEFESVGLDTLPVKSDFWYLLNEQMHPRWSAAVGWEFGIQALLLHGDMFMRIRRVTPWSSKIEAFEPYHPLAAFPDIVDDRLVYTLWNETTGTIEVVDQDDMIHVPGPGFDGRRGMSQIRHVLRQPVGMSAAAGELIEALVSDGLRPDLVLKAEGKLDEAKVLLLRKQWMERYSGLSNSNAPIVLGGDMDVKEISMSVADAQLIESRKLTDDDVCGIFGVMPYMIGRPEKTTTLGSSVEQFGISFVKYTLQRHMVKIAQELNRKVVRSGNRGVRHDVSSLERGDTKSLYETLRLARGRAGEPGIMTLNEVRRRLHLPTVPDGDTIFQGTKDAQKPDPAAAQ
ncbi:phage portal protein [Paraburkholderia tropica]|uniref:phage portal protein n=1 Tax=Paraburkholderia tropica TaxID=92647 RepID=UPI001601485A|nr:phage portal protein [Paraburkholderia tropica]QNB11570.1 phage portal protein [Paraburkholderia tropica]